MPQHVPNLYGTTIPNQYGHLNIPAPMGEVDKLDSSRICERRGEGVTKQRKKASRACDQCRKKRIKCRFNQHTGVCQGCLEVNEKCLFVRVPLKRGPAKKRSNEVSSDNFSSGNGPLNYRSRTHSYSINLGDNHIASLARNSSFPSISGLLVPTITTQTQQFWKVPYDDIRRGSSLATLSSSSSISTSFGENCRLGQNLNVEQESKDTAIKGMITPVEGNGAYLTSVYRQGPQPSQVQEQRANSYTNPFNSGRSRISSFSGTSEATTSEDNTQGKEHYMLTPNSVPSIEKERLNSLTAGCLGKKIDANTNTNKWERNPTWKSAYRSSDLSRPDSKKNDLLNQEAGIKPLIFSTSRQFDETPLYKVLDIYYNYFHLNFPIIPISQSKLTGMLVPVKPQAFDETHKTNSEIIQCFKTALEVLVFSKIKQSKPPKSTKSWSDDNLCDAQKGLYYTQNLSRCINECFQSLMTIKSKLKQSFGVTPSRIKFIFFSTIVILNFILVLTGNESLSLLGPSVGVFNEFQTYKLFLPYENAILIPLLVSNEESDEEQLDYAVLFKRSYILLSILDSLQSFRLGQPKLINLKVDSPIDTYFSDKAGHNQIVENPSMNLDIILWNLKLGEFITCFVLNRKSLQINRFQNPPATDRTSHEGITVEKDEHDNIACDFQILLKKKETLIEELLNIGQKNEKLPKNWRSSNAVMNSIGELVCSMINLISGILDSIVNANVENSVDLNLKPLPNTCSAPNSEDESISQTQRNTSKLGDESNKCYAAKYLPGTVSVFMLPMVEECSNIIKLIGPIPTILISLFIRNGNMASEINDKIMMLSTALNELVQITSLLNALESFRQNTYTLAKRFNTGIPNSTGGLTSVMKKMCSENFVADNACNVSSPEEEDQRILSKFADIGWKLMDDSELGCCYCFLN